MLRRVLLVLGIVLLVILAYIGGIIAGLYGEHRETGEVTERTVPAKLIASRAQMQKAAALRQDVAEPKQILFGDLHVPSPLTESILVGEIRDRVGMELAGMIYARADAVPPPVPAVSVTHSRIITGGKAGQGRLTGLRRLRRPVIPAHLHRGVPAQHERMLAAHATVLSRAAAVAAGEAVGVERRRGHQDRGPRPPSRREGLVGGACRSATARSQRRW